MSKYERAAPSKRLTIPAKRGEVDIASNKCVNERACFHRDPRPLSLAAPRRCERLRRLVGASGGGRDDDRVCVGAGNEVGANIKSRLKRRSKEARYAITTDPARNTGGDRRGRTSAVNLQAA